MALNISKLNFKKISEILDKEYNIECTSVSKIKGGSANSYHILSLDGDYVLKEFQDGFDVNRVQRDIDITKLLKESGIPTPTYVYNMDNRAYCYHEKNIVTLQEFITGDVKEYHTLTEEQCKEAAMYCFKILKVLNKSDIVLPSFKMEIFDLNTLGSSVDRCNYLVDKCKDDVIIKMLCNKKKMLLDACMIDFSHIKDITFLKSHGDYNNSQFIYDKDGRIKAILDFASAKKLPIVWELLRSFIFMDRTYNKGKFSLDGFINYLKYFNKDKILTEWDIEYMFMVYYIFLLNSTFGFEQYIANNSNEYYQIGVELYNQSKYLNENMLEMSKILKKRMGEVL